MIKSLNNKHREFIKKEIPDNGKVNVIKDKFGNITVKTVMGGNRHPVVKKIGNNTYYNSVTAEVITTERKSIAKGDNIQSVINSSVRWHDLVSANIDDHRKVLRYCLTFETKTLDLKFVGYKHRKFIEKLRRKFTKRFGQLEYMYSPELYADADGYHLHGLLYFPNIDFKPFIDCQQFKKMWGLGDIDIKNCQNRSELFNYILPHKTDSENKTAEHLNEKFERIKLIPSNVKLVRSSQGITMPTTTSMSYRTFKDKLGNVKPSYERVYYRDFYYEETGVKFRVWFFYRYYKRDDIKRYGKNKRPKRFKKLFDGIF